MIQAFACEKTLYSFTILYIKIRGLVKYVIENPSYPNPFAGANAAAQPPSVVRLEPDVQIPQTVQYSVGIDHQLRTRPESCATIPPAGLVPAFVLSLRRTCARFI